MAIRVKSRWFKEGRQHSPQEISDALAFTIWRVADQAVQNTRKLNFDIPEGPRYLDFLAEFAAFLVQVADRLAWRHLSAEARQAFTSNLANRIGETYAENRNRLLGTGQSVCKQQFIELVNQRAAEYADFRYDESGPEYGFYRYLAWCIGRVLNEEDAKWIGDAVITYEAPDAVKIIEKALHDLWETEPRPVPRRPPVVAD